jgi:hypothetical protein
MLERPSLMQAIEDVVKANTYLRDATRAPDSDDIDGAVADMDFFIAQLCRSVGLDKRTMEGS